jgi:hypothetical protein
MRIDSVPAGARVLIDGRDAGETPLIAQAVLPGEHYVRVVKDGVGSAWEKISVAHDEETASFTLAEEHATGPLAAVSKGIGKNNVDADVLKSVTRLGTTSKAEYVVFGGVRKNASTEQFDVKSYGLHLKDGAIVELADISLDQELLGANVEALKVVSDLAAKIQGDNFAAPQAALTPFESAAQPKNAAPATFVMAPASAGAPPPDTGTGEPAPAAAATTTGHHRGPAVAEEPKPEAPAAAAPQEKEEGSVLENIEAKRRKRHQQEEDEEETTRPARKAAPEDDTGAENEARPRKKHKAAEEEEEASVSAQPSGEDDNGEEEEAPKPKPKPKKGKKKASQAGLTPEQLEEMNKAQEAANSNSNNGGMIALWTSVGVVGAAALAVGAYFIFRTPPAATSATAHITW